MNRQRVRLVAQSPATPLQYRHPIIPSDLLSLERRYLHVFSHHAAFTCWRFFGLARLASDDLCPLPSPSFGLGLGVRDGSKFSLVKTRAPGLAPGWSRIRGWSIFGQGVGRRPVVRAGVPPRDRSEEATKLDQPREDSRTDGRQATSFGPTLYTNAVNNGRGSMMTICGRERSLGK